MKMKSVLSSFAISTLLFSACQSTDTRDSVAKGGGDITANNPLQENQLSKLLVFVDNKTGNQILGLSTAFSGGDFNVAPTVLPRVSSSGAFTTNFRLQMVEKFFVNPENKRRIIVSASISSSAIKGKMDYYVQASSVSGMEKQAIILVPVNQISETQRYCVKADDSSGILNVSFSAAETKDLSDCRLFHSEFIGSENSNLDDSALSAPIRLAKQPNSGKNFGLISEKSGGQYSHVPTLLPAVSKFRVVIGSSYLVDPKTNKIIEIAEDINIGGIRGKVMYKLELFAVSGAENQAIVLTPLADMTPTKPRYCVKSSKEGGIEVVGFSKSKQDLTDCDLFNPMSN